MSSPPAPRSIVPVPGRRAFLQRSGVGWLAATGVLGCAHGPQGVGWLDVRRLGARGDGVADDTDALQAALDQAAQRGGGTVFVPAGVYLTRPLRIGSRTTLHLDAGSVLAATTRLEDYPKEEAGASGHESNRAGLITARQAEDVAIVGRGTIDGSARAFVREDLTYAGKDFDARFTRQGEQFMKVGPEGFVHGPFARGDDRPGNLVRFIDCRNALLEGVTIQNSPTWTVHFERCVNVRVHGVDINSRKNGNRIPNDDGIDLTRCERVRIIGCDIDTGDDCLAVFGSRDVIVSACTLTSRSAGVRVGFKDGHIRDCSFDNLVIRAANRGLAVFVRSAFDVENVSFSNIIIETQHYSGRWWGNGEPIHVSALLWDPEAEAPGRIRNLRFRNIRAVGEAGMIVYGSPDSVIENLSFEDVELHIRKGALQADYGGNFDLRATRDKAQSIFKHDIPALHCENVKDLAIRAFDVSWESGVPEYFREALHVRAFEDISISQFSGRQAQAAGAAIFLTQGKNATIRDSQASPGTDLFVRAEEVQGHLLLAGNDARRAQALLAPAHGQAVLRDNLGG